MVGVSGPTAPKATQIAAFMGAFVIGSTNEPDLVAAFSIIFLSGLILVLISMLKISHFIHYIPYSVVAGFMCGIGVIVILTQINSFLGLESEPRPGIKSGSIKESKSIPLSEIVNMKDNTFLNTKKLGDIFNSSGINSNKIVMTCGSSVSAASLALAYSLINDDYIPKIYIGSWTEFGKK